MRALECIWPTTPTGLRPLTVPGGPHAAAPGGPLSSL